MQWASTRLVSAPTNLLSTRIGRGTNQVWPGLKDGFFPAVAGDMLIQGSTPEDMDKVSGGNYRRIFGRATAGHA